MLLDRCGEAIVVLNEGFLHINQATHLAKVSATYLRLIPFVPLVIFKELISNYTTKYITNSFVFCFYF